MSYYSLSELKELQNCDLSKLELLKKLLPGGNRTPFFLVNGRLIRQFFRTSKFDRSEFWCLKLWWWIGAPSHICLQLKNSIVTLLGEQRVNSLKLETKLQWLELSQKNSLMPYFWISTINFTIISYTTLLLVQCIEARPRSATYIYEDVGANVQTLLIHQSNR